MKKAKTKAKPLFYQKATDAELIHAFSVGIEEGRHTSVAAKSTRFVVFKIAGHSAWESVGSRQYVKTKYVLVQKGHWWMSNIRKREWEGRVTLANLKEALRRSEMVNMVFDGSLESPMCEECNLEMLYGEGYDGNGSLVGYYRCDECGWSVDV